MAITSGNGGAWRTQLMYSYKEVSRLSHVSVGTVRNWLHGYSTEHGKVEPLFKEHSDEDKVCSFLELIEIVVAASFRKAEHKLSICTNRTQGNRWTHCTCYASSGRQSPGFRPTRAVHHSWFGATDNNRAD
jgi:hypothetical protein